MPRQGAASGHHGESRDCCIACFRRQRQADSLIQANMVAYAWARRIAPRHPLSSRDSRWLSSCWRLGRLPSGCAVESQLERDECSASASTPFPDTYGNSVCRRVPRFAMFCRKFESKAAARSPQEEREKRSPSTAGAEVAFQTAFRSASHRHVRAIRATLS